MTLPRLRALHEIRTRMQNNAVEIIVVEDKPEDRQSIVSVLADFVEPAHIADFADEQKAVDYLTANAEASQECTLRLILLDFHLKQWKAPRLVAAIREQAHTSLTPIVILSDSGDSREIRDSYAHGANAFVRKPVDFEAFRDTVEMIGRFWLDVNESGH